MTAPQTPAEVRRQLLRGGFTPLPLYGKAPVIGAWQKRHDTTEHEIESGAGCTRPRKIPAS